MRRGGLGPGGGVGARGGAAWAAERSVPGAALPGPAHARRRTRRVRLQA